MLSRDYISRIIQTFFEALEGVFGPVEENDEEMDKKLAHLYRNYFGKAREVFLAEEPEEMTRYLESDPDYLDKCGMLAEIMYREAKWTKDIEARRNLARRVIFLYDMINNRSTDYSLVYMNRIMEMENIMDAERD